MQSQLLPYPIATQKSRVIYRYACGRAPLQREAFGHPIPDACMHRLAHKTCEPKSSRPCNLSLQLMRTYRAGPHSAVSWPHDL